MKTILALPILLIVFMLGCTSNNTNIQADVNADVNMDCVTSDFNNDQNLPKCTSGNQFPGVDTIPGIDNIPGVNIPNIPTGNTNQEGSGNMEVTEAVCSKIQFGVGFGGVFAQSYGVEFTYKGVAGYKGSLWCSYQGAKPGEVVTVYQNPFVEDLWFVAEEDGKVGSTHIENGTMTEVCDGDSCQPMVMP